MRKISVFLMLIMLALVFHSSIDLSFAAGNKPIALIAQTSGKVFIHNKSGRVIRRAALYTRLFPNQMISTGNGSSCTVIFKDRSTVKLSSKSKIMLSKINALSNKRRGVAVLRGGVYVRVVGGNNRSFNAFGPTAVAGVRGTEFHMLVADDGSTRMTVTRGRVDFNGRNGEQGLTSCTAGQYAEDNTGSGVTSGRLISDNPELENDKWEKKRNRELKRDPERYLKVLEADIRRVETNNRQTQQRVNRLRSEGVNRNNASQVIQIDHNVVRNSAHSRGIAETTRNIARRYGNRRGVRRRARTIQRYTNVVDQQIDQMDRWVANASRQIDKLIREQGQRIDDMMNNFMNRGFGQRNR